MTYSVLFSCMGNSCRSPMAEAIFKDLITKKKLEDDWIVDSAATADYQVGCLINRKGLRVLQSNGITSEHIAKQITQEDYDKFDYILGMDHYNIEDLMEMAPRRPFKAKIELLGSYDKENSGIIKDPFFYGTDEDFREVYRRCLRSCEGFLKKVYSEEN